VDSLKTLLEIFVISAPESHVPALPRDIKGQNKEIFFRGLDARSSNLVDSVTIVHQLLKHAQQLLTSGGHPLKALGPEAQAAWDRVTGSVAQLEALWQQNPSKENGIFLLLFCQIGLQLFSQPDMAVDVLSELEPVYGNWNKKKVYKGKVEIGDYQYRCRSTVDMRTLL
jgi:hypothetical protein